jgi:hypothetical protein
LTAKNHPTVTAVSKYWQGAFSEIETKLYPLTFTGRGYFFALMSTTTFFKGSTGVAPTKKALSDYPLSA